MACKVASTSQNPSEDYPMTRTRLTALAAAAAIAAGTLAPLAPAHAGGSVSISIAPGSADAEHAMRAGLGLFAIANGIKNGSITQNGIGNAAGLIQNGSGNLGIVHQEGNGHEGTLTQNGNGNAHGLFQFGQGASGHVSQSGGQTGATFQFGW
jgi:minor curlin subunit